MNKVDLTLRLLALYVYSRPGPQAPITPNKYMVITTGLESKRSRCAAQLINYAARTAMAS